MSPKSSTTPQGDKYSAGDVLPFNLFSRPPILRHVTWSLICRSDEIDPNRPARAKADLRLGAERLDQAVPDHPNGQTWRFALEMSNTDGNPTPWEMNFEVEVLIAPNNSMPPEDWQLARSQAALLGLRELSRASRELREQLSEASCMQFSPVHIPKESVTEFVARISNLDEKQKE